MINNNFTIRYAKPGDGIAIGIVHQKAVHEIACNDYPENILEAWHSLKQEIHSKKCYNLETKINEKRTILIVAENENEIIGFGEIHLESNTLVAVYINPNYKRTGIGTIILNRLEKISLENKLKYLTMDASLTAEKFYLKNGFEIIEYGFHKLRTGDMMKCVIMRKELTLK